MGGDFTPLKRAAVTFETCALPDGTRKALQTAGAFGLTTIYVAPRPPKKNSKPAPSKAPGKTAVLKQQMQAQISVRTMGLYDLVRGPNKRDWLEKFALSKLPYHPQWYRSRTRFDALLSRPLDFGTVNPDLKDLGSNRLRPTHGFNSANAHRGSVSSVDARVGDPIQGTLTQPLFTSDHRLILPQGAQLDGRITLTQHARMFHQGANYASSLRTWNCRPRWRP